VLQLEQRVDRFADLGARNGMSQEARSLLPFTSCTWWLRDVFAILGYRSTSLDFFSQQLMTISRPWDLTGELSARQISTTT